MARFLLKSLKWLFIGFAGLIGLFALLFFGLLIYEKIEQSMAPQIIKDFRNAKGMPMAQIQFTEPLVGKSLADVETLFEAAGFKCGANIEKLDCDHTEGNWVCIRQYEVEANLTVDRRIKDIRGERRITCL